MLNDVESVSLPVLGGKQVGTEKTMPGPPILGDFIFKKEEEKEEERL